MLNQLIVDNYKSILAHYSSSASGLISATMLEVVERADFARSADDFGRLSSFGFSGSSSFLSSLVSSSLILSSSSLSSSSLSPSSLIFTVESAVLLENPSPSSATNGNTAPLAPLSKSPRSVISLMV